MNDTELRKTQTLYGHMSVMRNRWFLFILSIPNIYLEERLKYYK